MVHIDFFLIEEGGGSNVDLNKILKGFYYPSY